MKVKEENLFAEADKVLWLIKEVNGILGAIDGDTIKATRKLVEAYNVTAWQVEQYRNLIDFLLDRVDNESDKHYVKKRMEEISKRVRERL